MEEDSYIVSNFHTICRLCLRKSGAMSSLFEYASEDSDVPLYERLSELAELQIQPNDGLPGRICHRCLYKTEKCVKFRSRCLASAAKLRRLAYTVLVVDPGRESPEEEVEEREEDCEGEEVLKERVEGVAPPGAVYMCQYCDRAFTDHTTWRAHEESEHDERAPYGCDACGLVFAERAGQAQHARSVHACARPYPCGQCARAFSRRSDLRKHAVVHTGARPFRCVHCGKAFSRNTNLSKHLRIHAGHRPHVCLQCPRSFVSKGDLARHALVHSGARPFTCSHCPLTFGRRDKLAKHEARHVLATAEQLVVSVGPEDLPEVPDHITGEGGLFPKEEPESELEEVEVPAPRLKAFHCTECSKSFARKRELDRHGVVHTGHKPFACARCDKRFGRKDKLVRHERIHDERKEFSCFECAASFSRKDSLMSHLKTHFPDLLRDNNMISEEEDEVKDEGRHNDMMVQDD